MKILTLLICVLIGLCTGYWFLKKEPEAMAVSPTAEFNLAPQDIASLEARSLGGDCRSAYQLARYHSNFTLKSEEAIRWFRLAVICPDINPKVELIALLIGDKNPAHKEEIRQLIQEIGKTDLSAAKRAEEAVQAADDAK